MATKKKMTFTEKQVLFYKEAQKQFAQGPKGGRKHKRYPGLCSLLCDLVYGEGPFEKTLDNQKFFDKDWDTDVTITSSQEEKLGERIWAAVKQCDDNSAYFPTNTQRLEFIDKELKRLAKKH